MTKKETVLEKEKKYRSYRDDAALKSLPVIKDFIGLDVRLSDINSEALRQATLWRSAYIGKLASHKPGWDWGKEINKIRRRPRRIELAIWMSDTLCGIVIGRVSAKRVVASIHLIEASPNPTQLTGNILTIATIWLNSFAILLGCTQTAIDRPIQDLVDFYMKLGFDHVKSRGNKTLRLEKIL